MQVEPDEATIPAVFAEVAARFAGRVALAEGTRLTTYRELAEQADAIATALRQRGVGRGSLVGLWAQRSSRTVAAILGTLRAGAAYVPFDPSYPPNQLRFMFEDSAPALMLVQRLPAGDDGVAPFWSGPSLDIDADLGPSGDDLPPVGDIAPEDLAYVMYTSGSTGRPKGVMVPHRAVVRLVVDNPFAVFGPDEVLLQLAPLSFDASTFEIWGALLHGARLVVLPAPRPGLDDIAAAIARHRVTTLWLTAGLFHLMVDHRLEGLKPLRQLLAGGDVLSRSHVARALGALPGCTLINGYGPTENTTFTCCYTVPPNDGATGPVPIGRPIARTEVHLLDDALRPVAEGEAGELCVGGAGLALGYLRRPDLTAERFVPNPFDPAGSSRLYRTGDRARRRPDGHYEFLGRADRQVKIDGKRIELDEVESGLRRNRLVGDAAVICVAGADGRRRLAAFVTAAAGQAVDEPSLRHALRAELPAHMLPATIRVLAALPLSPAGKVDRSRLELDPTPSSLQATPSSEVEATLLRIFQRLLGDAAVGLDDDFFELGGSSLQLIEMQAMLRQSLPGSPSVAEMYRRPTVRALARHIAAAVPSAGPELPLAPLTSLARPLSVPEYYHACIGSSRHTLERPREVVCVLRGTGHPDPRAWQRALDIAAAANPGARLRLVGARRDAAWRSDGAPPRLRWLEGNTWDAGSDEGADFIAATALPLRGGPTVELIVAPQAEGRSLLVLRALHAVMDGAGALHFLREIFRALRGESLLGSNAAFSDVELMRSLGPAEKGARRPRTCWLTGEPQGDEKGDAWRRFDIGPAQPHVLARAALAMADFARQHSDRAVRIAVPMDLRLFASSLRSTGNFSSMVFVHPRPEDAVDDFRGALQALLDARAPARYGGVPEALKLLPLPWLDRLVSRTPRNFRHRQAMETGVISHLGHHDPADFSGGGFRLHDMVLLAQPGSAFSTITGVGDRVEMVLNLPRVLAGQGRFDAVVAHLQRRLAG